MRYGIRRRRRGSTLVVVALMLVCIMGVTAIALDFGRFYVVNNELQTAVDAAAMGGVPELSGASPAATARADTLTPAHAAK